MPKLKPYYYLKTYHQTSWDQLSAVQERGLSVVEQVYMMKRIQVNPDREGLGFRGLEFRV